MCEITGPISSGFACNNLMLHYTSKSRKKKKNVLVQILWNFYLYQKDYSVVRFQDKPYE